MNKYFLKDAWMRPVTARSSTGCSAPRRGSATSIRPLTVAISAAGIWLSLEGRAVAEQPQSAAGPRAAAPDQAAELLQAGINLYDNKRWAEAEQMFRKAWEHRPTYDVAVNLGHTEMHLSKPREAAEHLSFAIRNWPISGNSRARKLAEQRFAEAQTHIGTLVIRVDVPGAELTLDGAHVGRSPLTGAVFVLPGRHVVRATLDGYDPASAVTSIERGGSRTETLSLHRKKEASATKSNALLITGAALSAVLAGSGVGLTLAASSKKTEVTKFSDSKGIRRGDCPTKTGCEEVTGILQEHDRLKIGATGAFIGSGVIAAATVVYWVIPSTSGDKRTGVRAQPIVTSSAGGLWVSGAF